MHSQEMIMTGRGPAFVPAVTSDTPEVEHIETRFGKVTISRANPIVFPNGLLGIPDKFQYCLTSLSNEKLTRFKLLQSLDDLAFSLLVLPMGADNAILAKEDIAQACKDLDMKEDDLAMFLVVTVHRVPGQPVKLSVNARAPIMVNTPKRTAAQYVYHHAKYEIQHPITL